MLTFILTTVFLTCIILTAVGVAVCLVTAGYHTARIAERMYKAL